MVPALRELPSISYRWGFGSFFEFLICEAGELHHVSHEAKLLWSMKQVVDGWKQLCLLGICPLFIFV